MGKVDTVTKDYMRNNVVFADAFNYLIYDGKQVIKPENLRELDTTEIALPFGNGSEVAVQKFRDLLKLAVLMADEVAAYLVLGIENESEVKYAEPVKNGLYDFLQYSKQVQQMASKHRKAGDQKGREVGEFLSGFYKDDKLTPVITLVILFGPNVWDGPRTLHEMMSIQDEAILKYVADYKLNLIEPAAMTTDDLDKFQSNLKSVLGYIKYSNNRDELKAFLSKDQGLKALEVEAAMVIKACTGTKIMIDEKEKVIDVCKAELEMIEEAKREGGETARLETLRDAIKDSMNYYKVNAEVAMNALQICGEDREILKKMIGLK